MSFINVYIRQVLVERRARKDDKRNTNEPHHDKTNKMICAPSEDSDQPGHPPSLITLHCPGSQVALSVFWAHMPVCWFGRVAAQVLVSSCTFLMS